MHADGLDSLLVAVPLLLILVAGVLRVDEHIFTPGTRKEPQRRRPRFGVADEAGERVFTDPDGRPSRTKRDEGK
jgi:hypothetical protein